MALTGFLRGDLGRTDAAVPADPARPCAPALCGLAPGVAVPTGARFADPGRALVGRAGVLVGDGIALHAPSVSPASFRPPPPLHTPPWAVRAVSVLLPTGS